MFNLPELRIDRVSFWLGFLAASLLWWLWQRIRPLIPQWIAQVKKNIADMRQKNLSGVEEYLRKDTIRRAQRLHIAVPLFPLDDVIIPPRLIAPPAFIAQEDRDLSHSIASQVIPYLPDWPELVTPLGVPTISPLDAVKSGRSIAIIGQPGSGKTVTLAYLASQIARSAIDPQAASLPVALLTHILDLDTNLGENIQADETLIKRISTQASVIMQPQVQRYLKAMLVEKSRRPILLVDGLDELAPEQMSQAIRYLRELRKKLPRLQIVTTASPDFVDGLPQAGFYPLSLAAWGTAERDALVQKWSDLWTNTFLPEVKKQFDAQAIDPKLYSHWLGGDPVYASPLEWTLRLWGAFAGDLSGSFPLGIIDSYVSRYLPNPALIPALEETAHAMLKKSSPSMAYNEMEKILSAYTPQKPAALDSETLPAASADAGEKAAEPDKKQPKKKTRREIAAASQGEQIITALLNGGVLVEHTGGKIRFSNPVMLGFLAGTRISPEEAGELIKQAAWPVASAALQFSAACSDEAPWIYPLIEDPGQPLFHHILTAARWLRDAPASTEWRSYMMRTLISLTQVEYLPIGSRARIIGAFLLTRDPSMPRLFKQLLSSKSAVVRQIGLMGCGALGSQQMINDIVQMLADPSEEVRLTACLALTAIPGETALNTTINVLLSGSEEVRQAAAEGLALREQGIKVLEEAAAYDDLLTRRAAVFGLLQVKEPWARQILEKIAVEDGQWVVRNAASQALETIQAGQQPLPKPLPPPSESPWLLTFASKLGMGILPGQPATDVLMQALKSGSYEEQIGALQYLRDKPDETVAREIYQIIYSERTEMHEPALHALWWMAISGFELPSPQMFGLG